MKRVLNLRNTVVFSLGLVGLLFLASSFTFGPTEDAQLAGNDPQKKEQRIKVMVNVDGKTTKIDTTFNLPDEKNINEKVDSMLSNLDCAGMGHHKGNRMIFRSDKAMKFHHKGMGNDQGDEQFDIVIQNGDSGKMCNAHKMFCVRTFGNEPNEAENDEDEMAPPPPPMPPHVPMMFHHGFGGDPFAFDTKDESVVSYEKKDIGNGLEKITIVRKKHDDGGSRKEVRVKAILSDDSIIKKKEDERKALKKLKDEADAKKENKKQTEK
ncbi:MAG: hypothetical protein WCJ95_04745 [Mariniphaga sp.]